MLLDLFMNALILVIITVIRATRCIETEKIGHFILVKRQRAGVGIGIFVILIEFAALTIRLVLNSVF